MQNDPEILPPIFIDPYTLDVYFRRKITQQRGRRGMKRQGRRDEQ